MMTRGTNDVGVITLHFTHEELGLVCDALDSHIYWELSDSECRTSGYVDGAGADDEETAAMIATAEALQIRLSNVLRVEEAEVRR
jgi:hypothetical protein